MNTIAEHDLAGIAAGALAAMLYVRESLAPAPGEGLAIMAIFSRRRAPTKGPVMLGVNCGIGTLVPI